MIHTPALIRFHFSNNIHLVSCGDGAFAGFGLVALLYAAPTILTKIRQRVLLTVGVVPSLKNVGCAITLPWVELKPAAETKML